MKPAEITGLRKRFDLTRAELAEMLRVEPRTVGTWEQGLRPVSGAASVLLEIMDAGEMPARYWKAG